VLHVAFGELPRGGTQQMFPREVRQHVRQCHAILQLIAETERTARLIKPGARPEPASQRLIQQPAIEHDVH